MKNEILFSILAVLFIFLLASGTAAAEIQIYTLDDLMAITASEDNLGKDYILMNDINVGAEETDALKFSPIGDAFIPFKGAFNGNGYIISNITFSDPNMDYVGLFGCSEGAEFSNIILENINVTGNIMVGSLLGIGSNTIIQFCSVNNSVVTGKTYTGGLVGVLFSSFADSNYAACTVNGIDDSYCVGGFVGYMFDSSSISDSSATGSVTGSNNVGGFVGYLESSSSVSDSFAKGNVNGIVQVGGFVGNMSDSSSVSASYAIGDVVGDNDGTGGFVGNMSGSSSVSESYAAGNVLGIRFVGGFVGSMASSSVSNSYAAGDAEGIGDFVGGFAGGMKDTSTVTNSYATGNAIENVDQVGGFVGIMSSSDVIRDSFYIGTPHSLDNTKGILVTSLELMQINTFTILDNADNYVSADWSISSSPDPQFIWYIDENNDFPKFYWSYSAPVPSQNGSGGSGTGSAMIVDNTPQNNTPQNNTTQNNTTQNNTTQNNTPVRDDTPVPEPTDPESKSFPWWILIIILILIVLGAAYYLYSKRNQN